MATLNPLRFYLVILQPKTLFTARVNGAPTGSYINIGYDTVTLSDSATAGQTVWFGTTGGGRERGICRLKADIATGSTSGTLQVGENDDVTPFVEDNDHLTIKQEFRLWPIYPRVVLTSPTEATIYEDWDTAWTDQTVDWLPMAVAGPPSVGFLEGGSCAINFVGDRSYPIAASATGSAMTYAWTAADSAEGTSAAQGTTGTPVAFTWANDGQYLVSLKVTDTNGKTHTNYTWAFVIDPADPDTAAYVDFDAFNDNMDFEQGGGECSFVVHGDADLTEFPEGSLVVLACQGDLTTPHVGWPFRDNVLFVGYIQGNTIRQNPISGDVSFRAATVDAIMRNTTMWPVSLTDKKGPKDWTMAKNLNTDRALSFLWHWRSTLSLMVPVLPCEYSPFIARQDFGPEDLHTNINGLMENAFGRVVCDHQGVLHHIIDHQLMLDPERAGKAAGKAISKATWVDNLDIEERADYEWPVNTVKLSGVYYPGSEGDVDPLFSEAPGDAPKAFGAEGGAGSFILDTQTNLNIRCGRMLGRDTQRYPMVRARFFNDGGFSIAPEIPHQATIESADNDRALALSPTLLARRISRDYDNELGMISMEVEFEPVVTGTAAGETVIMPPEPPPPELPPWDTPPVLPWTPPADPNAGPAVAADGAMGAYWTLDGGTSWAARNNGLGTTQLDFSDLVWDPWWRDKTGGHNPEQAILWGCGGGFIARSDDAGKNWTDVTLNLTDPPNTWADATAPTKTDLTYIQIHGDIHNKDRFFALAEWQNASSAWRGWLLRTDDDGLTWDWTSLGAPPTGYVAGTTYTFNFLENGQQEWYANTAWIAGAHDAPTFEYAASPCGNGAQWFQDDRVAVGGDWEKRIPIAYPFKMTFTSSNIRFRRPAKGILTEYGRYRLYTSPDQVTWTQVGSQAGTQGGAICETITLGTNVTNTFVMVHHNTYATLSTPDNAVLTQVQFIDLTIHVGDIRPIRMDLDTENGTQLYLTANYNDLLFLERWSVDAMARAGSVVLCSATPAQVAARTFWAAPHCPHQPGTADFGDHIYAFGRFQYTGTNRLAYSTDSGENLTVISDDATLGTGTTSWIGAIETPTALEVLAFLNDAAPGELYRTTDHVAWAKLNQLPFPVDPAGVSRHWGTDADLLIADREAAPATGSAAAQLASPYTDPWIAADGAVLPKAADGGAGFPAIIWV